MKTRLLLWLALILKYASLVTGLSALPQLALLPPDWLGYATLAFAAASLLKDTCHRLGDLLDDGRINQSFGKSSSSSVHLLILTTSLLTLTLPSCSSTSSTSGDSGGQVSTSSTGTALLLGVSAAGWQHIAAQAAAGALQGALQGAATTYTQTRQTTASAKAVHDPRPAP